MVLITERPVEAPTQAPVKTPAEILEHAALIIEERGWWDGQDDSDRGTFCALTAIDEAHVGQYATFHAATNALRRVIGGCDYIPDWNDAQPNGAVVVAALRAAAELAR